MADGPAEDGSGTNMYFAGLPNKQQQDDVVAYLKQFDQNGQRKNQ